MLLDHDLSTVIYNRDGSALLSLAEIHKDAAPLKTIEVRPRTSQLPCGVGRDYVRHDDDPNDDEGDP